MSDWGRSRLRDDPVTGANDEGMCSCRALTGEFSRQAIDGAESFHPSDGKIKVCSRVATGGGPRQASLATILVGNTKSIDVVGQAFLGKCNPYPT